ncbi:ORF38 [White spot syndrome virus]|uniref:Wsv023 n=5 Tax=White spot syndrome virus TaxID=342409 RepID=Q77JA2_WSSVS|nr:wsv023 [Shrimp white spot syndrome virus]YP_009220483.1 hypothetical protein SWSSV_gp009 [White spot syndrome virus]AYW76497.1 hypothetical protein [Procambarus clarkii virus]AAK77707.1 ORF38 [White spot syndrome virus]AAL33027.1 wsv023 [Shrimp white spot syndrome virus]ABJ08842.1 orf023 [White spot syndrome virus]AFX59400.1 wsv023 [White spot syndrome virus]
MSSGSINNHPSSNMDTNKMEEGEEQDFDVLELDYSKIIHDITAMLSVAAPPPNSILDASDGLIATASATAPAAETGNSNRMRLDKDVCQLIERDIELVKSDTIEVDSIIRQLLYFGESASEKNIKTNSTEKEPVYFPKEPKGEAVKLAKNTPVLDTITKLDWMANICQSNKIGVENLASALQSGQLIWTTFPAAVYASLDSFYHIAIMWKLLGSFINIEALSKGSKDNLLPRDDIQVVHAKQEIAAMLQSRQNILGRGPSEYPPVPITAILSRTIIPLLRNFSEKL